MAGLTITDFLELLPKTNSDAVLLAPFLSTVEFNMDNARFENPASIVRSYSNAGGGPLAADIYQESDRSRT